MNHMYFDFIVGFVFQKTFQTSSTGLETYLFHLTLPCLGEVGLGETNIF